MATLVTEVTSTSPELTEILCKVVGWFRDAQTAFRPEPLNLPDEAVRELTELAKNGGSVRTTDVFAALRSAATELKGTHERIILFTDHRLDGEQYGNLFSSVEEDDHGSFTGLAAVSTRDVERLTDGLPIAGYLFQQLVSINMRWVVGRPMLHRDGPKECLFHKRLDKRLIALSVREMRLCDRCRQAAKRLDNAQWQSLKDVMHDVSKAACAEDPRKATDELLASRQRSKRLEFVKDMIDLWRRLRAGKARFAIASFLAIAGVGMISPPWWQQFLTEVFGWATGTEPSFLQQLLGFLVILLAVVLVVWKQRPAGDGGRVVGA